jgi:hypothetical protein
MATLQEALEGVQNGQTYVHHYGDGVREFLSLRSDPEWAGYVQHDVIGPEGGGQATFTPKDISGLPHFTQKGWEPTGSIR